jgi:plasmid maintenance system antidote protein VapI
MTLRDHLKRSGETVTAFAVRIQQPRNTVSKIDNGQRQPSLPLAVKIVNATGGKVPLEALVRLPDARPVTDTPAEAQGIAA